MKVLDKTTQKHCPICQSDLEAVWRERSYEAHRCLGCDVISTSENIPFEFEEAYFQNNYVHSREARSRQFRKMIASLPVEIEAPILDVGAGLGFFVNGLPPGLAESTTVVEPSAFARRYLKHTSAAQVYSSLDEIPSDQPPFATVTFWDVLAHLENPVKTLRETRRLMKKGGVIVIKTPYHPLRLFRAARMLAPIRAGRSLLNVPSMRVHFTPASMGMLLRGTGFSISFWQWTTEAKLHHAGNPVLGKSLALRLGKLLITQHLSFIAVAKASQ